MRIYLNRKKWSTIMRHLDLEVCTVELEDEIQAFSITCSFFEYLIVYYSLP